MNNRHLIREIGTRIIDRAHDTAWLKAYQEDVKMTRGEKPGWRVGSGSYGVLEQLEDQHRDPFLLAVSYLPQEKPKGKKQ